MRLFLCLTVAWLAISFAGQSAMTLALTSVAGAQHTASTTSPGGSNDWKRLWQPSRAVLPQPVKVRVGSLGDLGKDLEHREWLMVPTEHHQVLFQDSADRRKVGEICAMIDGVYAFLQERSPAKAPTPIRAFLVPDERGQSRCSRTAPVMRTGELGDVPFLLTSLLHEETHLFNFAFLGERAQDWWSGEYGCLYFHERALLDHQQLDVKEAIASRLPRGPVAPLGELDFHGKNAFEEALAVQFFLEERYGRERINEFRRQCLISARTSNGGRLPNRVFQGVFGKDVAALNTEWLAFYGWTNAARATRTGAAGNALDARVTYTVEKESVQDAVRNLAAQVGLGYDFEKSRIQTEPLCRRWLHNVAIQNRPCRDALETLLGPVGLRYEIEHEAIVLYRK